MAASPAPWPAEPTGLPKKVKFGLQECRLLALGLEILLGFSYRAFFGETFKSLGQPAKLMLAVGLACLLVSISLLFAPIMLHRIVYGGRDEPFVYLYTNRVIAMALLPLAAAIGLDLYVLVDRATDARIGLALGLSFTVLAIAFWYGIEIPLRRPESWMKTMEEKRPRPEAASLSQLIEQLMTETRIILPGVQALLGFQLFAVLSKTFDKLSTANKLVHVAALAALALSMILLMAPAAYHRLVTGGEATQDVFMFSHWALIGSMIPLSFGLCADFYVALTQVASGPLWPAVAAAIALALMLTIWFALPLLARRWAAAGHPGRD